MREPATTPARVEDIHAAALAMPYVSVESAGQNPVYQVGGKSFVFFRNPRKDAFDPATGELYDDVIVIWVGDEDDKAALVQDESGPFFTTPHFHGHRSVLIRAAHVGQVSRAEITELVRDAWLSRASKRRAKEWLTQRAAESEPT
ncbi:hypothetical protein EXU48_00185 [Occultella glacieicola]|uniref:MmcQ/YjbR family DNA-binding protein n=1 Tax=Occultella glacieicola TaxID=2518684 RepID=A0ABY2E9R1_9MICO|nr:MmcQ/YjbR family DNA-binding protein [Occultella glacieicola]TDE98676.1 hypothetical protein EXU48_00185 [Occultella glacieicola]